MAKARKKSTAGNASRGQSPVKSAGDEKAASNERIPQTDPLPRNCKRYAKRRMAEVWPKIVEGLIKKARAGSYNHTKLLVEVSGIKDEDGRPQRKQESMVKILLKRLEEKAQENGDGGREADSAATLRNDKNDWQDKWQQPRDGKGRWLRKDLAEEKRSALRSE